MNLHQIIAGHVRRMHQFVNPQRNILPVQQLLRSNDGSVFDLTFTFREVEYEEAVGLKL